MMKRSVATAAVAAFCMGSTAAMAEGPWAPQFDEPIVLNGGEPFSLTEGAGSVSFEVDLADNPYPVIGFSFAGVIEGISGNATWASDTRLEITAPDGTTISRGGYPAPGGGNDWDFQGDQSTNDGLYAHGLGGDAWSGNGEPDFAFDKVARGGVWTFTFTQDFGSVTWKGVTIVLHKQVPAPGALALLGLAGLCTRGRRRR